MSNFLDFAGWGRVVPYPMQAMWHRLMYRPQPIDYRLRAVHYVLASGMVYEDVPFGELRRGILPPRYRYRHFTVPKRDGGVRHLAEPGVDLKAMQGVILKQLLGWQRPHAAAVGYRRGMSIADHAWAHAGARTVVTADITDFFPSTTRYRVQQFWKGNPIGQSAEVVQLLTNLTTYRGSLPQGAPTSPALSNLVNVEMDSRLARVAVEAGATYTRYADDLAFSWQAQPRPPADFEALVRRVLHEYGYRLGDAKGWRVWSRREEAQLTGLVLTKTGEVDVPPPMRDKMRDLARSTDPIDRLRLEGYRGYREMVTRRPYRLR